jgi:perosamine synthetase
MQYHEAFKNIDCLILPIEKEGYFSNYQSYSIYLKDICPISRNDLMQQLLDNGIASRRGIMTTHRETAYAEYCQSLKLPVSEDACDRSILIPLFVPMLQEEVDKIINTFKKLIQP